MALGVHVLRLRKAVRRFGDGEHHAFEVVLVPVEPDLRVIPGMVEVVADKIVRVRFLHGVVHHRAQVAGKQVFPVVEAGNITVVVHRGDEVAPSAVGEQHIHRLVDDRSVVNGDLLMGEDAVLHGTLPGEAHLGMLVHVIGAVNDIPGVQEAERQREGDARQQQQTRPFQDAPEPVFHASLSPLMRIGTSISSWS